MNHSCKKDNLSLKVKTIDGHPRIVLLTKRDIVPGEELLYNYGERRPWKLSAPELQWIKG